MDEATIKKWIADAIEADKQKAQYGVSRVPFHTHNGIDSPKITMGGGISTVEDGATTVTNATILNFTNGATVTNAGNGEVDVAITGSGAPGGSDGDVQFNNSGSFGGDPGLTYGSGILTIGKPGGLDAGPKIKFDASSSPDEYIYLVPDIGNLDIGSSGQTSGPGGGLLLHGGAGTTADNSGDVLIGGLGLVGFPISTTATGGFVRIVTTTGTPTGVPDNGDGALLIDLTANKLWLYKSGWKSVTFT